MLISSFVAAAVSGSGKRSIFVYKFSFVRRITAKISISANAHNQIIDAFAGEAINDIAIEASTNDKILATIDATDFETGCGHKAILNTSEAEILGTLAL